MQLWVRYNHFQNIVVILALGAQQIYIYNSHA